VEANGVSGTAFPIFVSYRTGGVHVLTSDDTIVGDSACLAHGCSSRPYVTHGDGSFITAANPARAGETIVFYAVGLGVTAPVVKSGEAAPFPHARVNAQPVTISYFSGLSILPLTVVQPVFAGLVPGYVGLYQLNIKLPEKLPDQINSCASNGWNTQLYSVGFCWTP